MEGVQHFGQSPAHKTPLVGVNWYADPKRTDGRLCAGEAGYARTYAGRVVYPLQGHSDATEGAVPVGTSPGGYEESVRGFAAVDQVFDGELRRFARNDILVSSRRS